MDTFLRVKRLSLKLLHCLLVTTVAVLVLDVLLGVASRYLWGEQVKWTEELATLLLIWVSFLGIAAAFERRAHLGIEMLTDKLSCHARQKLIVIAHCLTLLFILVVFIGGGIILTRQAVINWNLLPALQISDMVMYLPLPVSGIFILIYELGNLLDDLHQREENENG